MIPWHRVKRWTDALYINEREVFHTLIHCSVLDFITGFLVETSQALYMNGNYQASFNGVLSKFHGH